jgi:hypothetical protein
MKKVRLTSIPVSLMEWEPEYQFVELIVLRLEQLYKPRSQR